MVTLLRLISKSYVLKIRVYRELINAPADVTCVIRDYLRYLTADYLLIRHEYKVGMWYRTTRYVIRWKSYLTTRNIHFVIIILQSEASTSFPTSAVNGGKLLTNTHSPRSVCSRLLAFYGWHGTRIAFAVNFVFHWNMSVKEAVIVFHFVALVII